MRSRSQRNGCRNAPCWIISQRMAGVKMDEIGTAALGISESRVSQILFEIRLELERVLVGKYPGSLALRLPPVGSAAAPDYGSLALGAGWSGRRLPPVGSAAAPDFGSLSPALLRLGSAAAPDFGSLALLRLPPVGSAAAPDYGSLSLRLPPVGSAAAPDYGSLRDSSIGAAAAEGGDEVGRCSTSGRG